MPRQTQSQTLRDIYERLNTLTEIASNPCDRCEIEVKKFYEINYAQGSLTVSSYLETRPAFPWVNSLNSQVGQFVQFVNANYTPRSISRIYQFMSKAFRSVTPPVARSETPLVSYVFALQLSYFFILSSASLTTKPRKTILPPETGNQVVDLQDYSSVLIEVLEYPKEFGRYFTGHEPPYDYVIPNQFWIFFESDSFGGILSYSQIQYRSQVFSIPLEATTLFVQAPNSATLRVTLMR